MIDIFRQVDLFRGLTPEQLARLEAIATVEDFQQGAVVCQQGDPADKLYIVREGQVEVTVQHRSGEHDSLLFLGSGQVIGEMTLVDAGRRSASVLAADSPTRVLSIPNAELSALCEEDTAIGYVIMRNIAQDLSFKLRHRDYDPGDNLGNEGE